MYLYFNADGETIYVGKARALRDRVRNYLGALRLRSEDRRAPRRGRAPRGHRHRLGRRGAGARKQPHQAARARNTTSCCATTRTTRTSSSRPTRRSRACSSRGASERDGSFYAGPFLPAQLRAQDDGADAPAVRHPIVQRSDHRQARSAVPRVRHQTLHRAVRRHRLLAPRSTGGAVKLTRLFLEGRNDELVRTLQDADARAPRERAVRGSGAAARRDADRADAARSAAEDGDGRARAPRRVRHEAGPAGVVVQVFQVRSGRVVERVELGSEDGASPERRDGEVLDGGASAVLRAARRAAGVHVPAEPDEREALEAWLSERAGRRVRIVVPQRGEKRGLVDLANRNAALAYQTRFNQTTPRNTTRSRRCRRCSRCRRCRAASSASTSRRSRAARRWRRWSCAKTAACGEASIGSSASGARARGRAASVLGLGNSGSTQDRDARVEPQAATSDPVPTTTSRRCTKSSSGAIASCSSRAARFRT